MMVVVVVVVFGISWLDNRSKKEKKCRDYCY
jgi:hypothetical protein